MHYPYQYCCFADFRAEAETKAKLEKVAEIKRINAQIMAIKSEISKYEDTLKEYQLYKRFLFSVTPKVVLLFIVSLLLILSTYYIKTRSLTVAKITLLCNNSRPTDRLELIFIISCFLVALKLL